MIDIKKLPRDPVRPEKESNRETEIWQPDWKCFCCHDSGIIVPHLAALVIDGYNRDRDKLPRCSQPGCKSGSDYDSEAVRATVDYRIDSLTCAKLDSFERSVWQKTVQARSKRIQEATSALAKEKSLRVRDRTTSEDNSVAQRHRRVVEEDWGLVAATEVEKKWIAGWEKEGI